jgi:4-amino-4-deoxy-L-arabinose transferase-like glycosyltransferase
VKLRLILIFTLFFHLLFLNFIPTGITNDELHFVLNAKSVFLNFSNLAYDWNPLSFNTIPHETSSELPFLLLAPIIGPLPLNLFTARLPSAILSVLSVYLIYLISAKLFTKQIAIIVTFTISINPWYFYVYRTSFDAPIAIFFLLLSLYCLISLEKKWLLITVLPITLSFYSYIGTKVIIFPFILLTSIFLHRNYRQLILINLFTLSLSLLFIINLSHSSVGQRTSELITPWSLKIVNLVESERAQTLSSPITPIFINKFTVYFQFVLSKWFNSFSPNLLFLKGDDTFTGSFWRHGYFYYIDAVFILLGILFLYHQYRPVLILFLSFLLISPIPEAIRSDQIPAYVFHSSLQYPILAIITGLGMYYLLSLLKNNYQKLLLVLIYFASFVNLLFIYFFQYPFYASESFNSTNQLLSRYIITERSVNPSHVFVFGREPDALFKNYIFYSNSLNRKTFSQVSNAYISDFEINNITFLRPDTKINILPTDVVIVQEGVNAPSQIDVSSRIILNRLDNHQPAFNIFNGKTCWNYPISNSVPALFDLNLSNSENSLCSYFFITINNK